MRKLLILSFIAASFAGYAQEGYVFTIAGCVACPNTGDGIPAKTAKLFNPKGVATDGAGNIYVADMGYHKVQVIDAQTGLINTVVGNGTAGNAGDGGPATNAELNGPEGIFVTPVGDIYVADGINDNIRRIDAATHIIQTIVNPGTQTKCLYVDESGNIYFSGTGTVEKWDAMTNTVSVVAGIGNLGNDAGDGGPALNATISTPLTGITLDAAHNIYIVSGQQNTVRKIDAQTGIISCVAGGGASYAEDIAATSAKFDGLSSCSTDAAGNLYLADNMQAKIRKVDITTGHVYTLFGNGAAAPDAVPAVTAGGACDQVYLSQTGDIYFSDGHKQLFKIDGANYFSSDSFHVTVGHNCTNTTFFVGANHFVAGRHVKAYFGDMQNTDAPLSNPAFSQTLINHAYSMTGAYGVKMVLYDGNNKIDSLHFIYDNVFCNTVQVKLYVDANGDCANDSGEVSLLQPVLIEVDSSNVAIDTMSVISGFYYTGHGNAGDEYKFKVISATADLQASCPAGGIVNTILQAGNSLPVQMLGFNCSNSNLFDLSADAVVPITGTHDQCVYIHISNAYCAFENANVTAHFSPKYGLIGSVHPAPASTTANSITWNLANVSNRGQAQELSFQVWNDPVVGPLTVNDTVQEYISVSPTNNDVDITNNIIIHEDTVKGSCDPNLIEVTPKGNILAGTQLKYRIEFENVGNDTAFNIYVLDTLPNELDASSLRLVSSTHTMYVSPYGDGLHNIVKFDFPHINLLDSSHHEKCTGAFTYTIKTKAGLPFGTHIDHKAGIYFDDNGLVETNMVENIIGFPASVNNVSAASKVQVYPNPASIEVTIKADNGLYSSFTISNSIGQEVMGQTLNSGETRVNVKSLPAGVYYITLKGADGNAVRKFVKM